MACEVCGSSEVRDLGTKAGYRLVRCGGCGLVAVAPRPDAAELAAFYANYTGNAVYREKTEAKLLRARRRIRGLTSRVPGRRFLDVGCNLGFSVEAARRLGFAAAGIDIGGEAVAEACRRFPWNRFGRQSIEEHAAEGASYDLVFCTEVIEHVRDLAPFVAGLGRVVAPGGVLFLTTPDAGHWRVPRDLLRWKSVVPPTHLRLFTKRALELALGAQGFGDFRYRLNLGAGIKVTAVRGAA